MSNLLDILAACTGDEPAVLATKFDRYSELKTAVADAVVAELAPVRERYSELSRDPDTVARVLSEGSDRARTRASATVVRARTALGLT